MSIQALAKPLTYEDLEQITDRRHRYEILQGKLIVSANPAPIHVIVGTRMTAMMSTHVAQRRLGIFFGSPVDVRITRYDIVGPDMCFVCNERLSIVTDRLVDGAPDLAIDILSPSNPNNDRVRKMALYASGGVREYWLVDPQAKSIRVISFTNGEASEQSIRSGTIPSTVLPDLPLAIDDIFSER